MHKYRYKIEITQIQKHLSLPDYLHSTYNAAHRAAHWTSFSVDIVLMTPVVHWSHWRWF